MTLSNIKLVVMTFEQRANEQHQDGLPWLDECCSLCEELIQ